MTAFLYFAIESLDDIAGSNKPPMFLWKLAAGQVCFQIAARLLAGLGSLFLLRGFAFLIIAISEGTFPTETNLAVTIVESAFTPAWIIGGILIWQRKELGFVTGLGLLFQASMLFVAVILYLLFQPQLVSVPLAILDVIVLFVMGMNCFIPFGLSLRDLAVKSGSADQADVKTKGSHHVVQPIYDLLLKSPLHGMINKGVLLVSVTGRKSGRTISTPTNYLRDGNTLWGISWRYRNWWKNLRGGAQVRVLLAGKSVEGRGQVIEEQKTVAQSLFDCYSKVPQVAKYVQIGLDAVGKPLLADCERAAQKLVVVRIDLA